MTRTHPGGTRPAHPTTVVVDDHSAGWLARGFCWVYPQEVVPGGSRPRPGQPVSLADRHGRPLGTGLWDDGWLAVRRMRVDPGPLDDAWMTGALEACLARRGGLLPAATTAWRAVHAENDDLPGLRVDVWGAHLHVTLDSPALRPLLPPLQRALIARFDPGRITLGGRTDPRDTAREEAAPEVLWTRDSAEAERDPLDFEEEVEERGLRFRVRPAAGSDAGLFSDMRDNRAWLDRAWAGRRVLNLFAYTGAFSVFAARGGATEVVTADLAATALARSRTNLELNGLVGPGLEFEQDDTFRLLDRYRRRGRRFDLVLADPPPFSHGPGGAFSVERDLARLTAACLRVLTDDGLLVLACNQGSVAPRAFQKAVEQGAARAERRLYLLHGGSQPPDFPAAVNFPEGRYLKLGVWAAAGSCA